MKISKDGHELDVSPNAFESMYKRLGYKKAFNFDEESKEIDNSNKSEKGNTNKNK